MNEPVIFLGTSDFAVPSLRKLVQDGIEVVSVITRPDRRAKRGKKLTSSPVKETALQLGLEVYQPERLTETAAIEYIRSIQPRALVLVAYGVKVPGEVLDIPKSGAINLHPSLLPKYRGAAPIQWALIHGEPLTGLTTMYMDEGLDTGDIIYQKKVEINSGETYGQLSDRLSDEGAVLLSQTVRDVLECSAPRIAQDDEQATRAPLLKKADEKLDWTLDSKNVAGWISGLSPKPGAYSYYGQQRVKLLRAKPASALEDVEIDVYEEHVPGQVIEIVPPDGIGVATGSKAVLIEQVQPENKAPMDAISFVNGYGVQKGDVFR